MDLDRYHRQMLLPGIGPDGQRRLAGAHALIVGCGALGCTGADLLARAGVGTITIVDRDIVETTNLQRQSLFTEADANAHMPKAAAAAQRLGAVNSTIAINAKITDLNAENAERIVAEAAPPGKPAVIVDGTDNFETRYLLNDLAVKTNTPLVYAGVVATSAMAMSVIPGDADADAPCLRCVFRDPPPPGSQPTCDTAGVLGPVASIVASYQACEAIKFLVGRIDLVQRSLLSFDPWHGSRTRMDLSKAKDPDCPCCGKHRYDFLARKGGQAAVSLCGSGAVQIAPARPTSLDLDKLATRLSALGNFRRTDFLVCGTLTEERDDTGKPVAMTIFEDGRAQIRGVSSPERAQAIYDRTVGG
jgi:molybdopterin-synthase adenylyltransferase